jgi:hypothetical protein
VIHTTLDHRALEGKLTGNRPETKHAVHFKNVHKI